MTTLNFRHAGHTVSLRPGESWAAPSADDHYRDTAAETLQSIVREVEAGRPWRDVVASRYEESNPWLHRIVTSPARDLFFRQHPPAAGARILDIGAGWGQLALPLARQDGAQVTALEPTPERLAFIQAAAVQERLTDRLHFIQAQFQEVEFEPSFDLVCCVGVLEWVPKFCSGDPRAVQIEFLRHMRAALRPGGQCCVGIENRFGLKYLLGARDDHTGTRNVSVLDAAEAAVRHQALTGQPLRAFTYTHAEYQELFRAAGFTEVETHAAFPDYKLPELILPCAPTSGLNQTLLEGPIPREHDGLDGHSLPDPEQHLSHYRSLARMGLAQFFCPSFFFLLR